jgi:hypothetical protein
MSWLITPTGPASLGLLDQYGGAAAAYSLRNLSIYNTSPVVRVRRSSDNTEQDFTATQVTDGTLTTFCGAGDGFVRTWYDQSGNGRDAKQPVTTSQPKIVSSGALVTDNSLPTLNFNGTSNVLSLDDSDLVTSSYLITAVAYASNNGPLYAQGDNSGWGSRALLMRQAAGIVAATSAGDTLLASSTFTSQSIISYQHFSGEANGEKVYVNGSLSDQVNSVGGIQASTGCRIGSDNSGVFLSGAIQELIVYRTSQSANRTAIEANINAHYAIY